MRRCKVCGVEKPLEAFNRNWKAKDGRLRTCAPCRNHLRRTDPNKDREIRRNNLWQKFKITLDEYDAMLESQGGVCAICEKPCPSGRALAVDHCHDTGQIRGLLCMKCNRGLGLLGDSVEQHQKCIEYLGRIK